MFQKMNKNRYAVLFFFACLLGCAPTMQEALEYNNKLTGIQIEATESIKKLNKAFDLRTVDSLEIYRTEALVVLQKLSEELAQITPRMGKEGEDLYTVCKSYVEVLQNLLQNEYTEQVRIYLLSETEYTEVEKERFDALNKEIDEKYFPAYDAFATAQEVFVAKWEIILKEDK